METELKSNGDLVLNAVRTALDYLKVDDVNLDVIEVDKENIKQANAEFRGVDKVTDVLSFPLLELKAGQIPTAKEFPHDVDPETGEIQLGDILVCAEVAKEQSKEFGHSFEREFSFLVVHGVLHLLGYDHMTPKDEQLMMTVAEEILTKMGIGK